jgi:hypothetical protein
MIVAATMVELLDKIYKAEGRVRKAGESRTAFAMARYDITADWDRNRFEAVPKDRTEQD